MNEEKILRANPEIKEIYEYALAQKKRIIFASDMYLPLSFIVKILQKNGFSQYEKIYLSCEIGKRKDTGPMYPYILSDVNISADQILHIGDNKHSDVTMAKKYGLKTFYYQKVIERFLEKNIRAKLFYQHRKSLGRSIILSLLAFHDISKTDTNNYWENFGYLYAGIAAFTYAKWIESNATKEDIKAMQSINVPESADHSDYELLLSVDCPFWKRKEYKKCLWKTSSQRIAYALTTPFRIKVKGLRYINMRIFPYVILFFFAISIAPTKKIKYSISIGGKKNE